MSYGVIMIQTEKQKYIQDYILRLIKNGMRYGDVLPSIKELSIRLSVSQMTTSRVMGHLEAIGVLRKIHGKGTFVGGHELLQQGLPEHVRLENRNGKAVITFLSPFPHYCPGMIDYTRGIEAAIDHSQYVLFNRHVYINKVHEEEELKDAIEKSAGIILISSYPPAMQYIICDIIKKNYPVVLLDRWPGQLLCHSVAMDHTAAIESGMNEFYRNGHRRIIYLEGNDFGYSSTAARIESYRSFMIRHELEPVVYKNPQSVIRDIANFPKEKPTAVFTNCDSIGYELADILGRNGQKIPDDISIIGIDDDEKPANCPCRLTSIAQPKYELGVKTVELLNLLLAESPPAFIRYFLPGKLNLHQSVKNITDKENGK
ncbi:MAG: HTH-type transcriptional repressor CytR [Lentisphaerae bacterium ADurb.Bin242]|nr:MAG: HTH-type transcriptional repressor CytR [Lentisphaerae bacterium ADurb.Bin242]